MVRRKLGLRTCLVVMALFLIFVPVKGAHAMEDALYAVEGQPIRWVLEGMPGRSRQVEFLEFEVVRTTEDDQPLEFRLSRLVDVEDEKNEFPRDLIVLDTPYDSDLQTLASTYAQTTLMDAKDDSATIKIGLRYRSYVRAGTYKGYLYSEQGDDIPVEIVVDRYVEVTVNSITIDANEGPGIYMADLPAKVGIRANHNGWVIGITSSGLYLLDDQVTQSVWDAEPKVGPFQLSAILGDQVIPLHEGFKVVGAGYGDNATFSFGVQAEVDWKHPAGNYFGVILLDVQEGEESEQGGDVLVF